MKRMAWLLAGLCILAAVPKAHADQKYKAFYMNGVDEVVLYAEILGGDHSAAAYTQHTIYSTSMFDLTSNNSSGHSTDGGTASLTFNGNLIDVGLWETESYGELSNDSINLSGAVYIPSGYTSMVAYTDDANGGGEMITDPHTYVGAI